MESTIAFELPPRKQCIRILNDYAFGREAAQTKASDKKYAPAVPTERSAFLYRMYDCPPRDEAPRLTASELAIANSLNAKMTGRDLLSAVTAAPEVNRALAELELLERNERRIRFWELDPAHLDPTHGPPPEGQTSWWLHWAWAALEQIQGIAGARTHQILHRLRPEMFPLIDDKTAQLLGGWSGSWLRMWEVLDAHKEEFGSLEEVFGRCAVAHGGVGLPRTRLLDILLWMKATDRWSEAS